MKVSFYLKTILYIKMALLFTQSSLILFGFAGRDCAGACQDRPTHGTPGRLDGQLGGHINGFSSYEKKKYYYDGKITIDQHRNSSDHFSHILHNTP